MVSARTASARKADNSPDPVIRPVDLVHLSHYTLGDTELEREVLQLFLAQSSIYLERLKTAAKAQDWRDAAHTIKGSAQGIGAWRVAETAEVAELARSCPKGKAAVKALNELEQCVEETNVFITNLLAKGSV